MIGKNESDKSDYIIFNAKLSEKRITAALERIASVLPGFRLCESVTLVDLDKYLSERYKAIKADWKDINKCTRTRVKRYNGYCKDVFCVSEAHVVNEEYYSAYIIKRENCVNPSVNSDDYFYDMFVIAGSEDGKSLSSYYIGGYSEGFADEMYVLCGNK